MRRIEQALDPSLKGLRWVLLKDRSKLTADQRIRAVASCNTRRVVRVVVK
jgi:hypothetical protein